MSSRILLTVVIPFSLVLAVLLAMQVVARTSTVDPSGVEDNASLLRTSPDWIERFLAEKKRRSSANISPDWIERNRAAISRTDSLAGEDYLERPANPVDISTYPDYYERHKPMVAKTNIKVSPDWIERNLIQPNK